MDRIVFHNVSKKFVLSGGRQLLRGHIRNWLGRSGRHPFYALRNVSFSIREGESLAVVGANGAGKSTLLNMVTGLCPADEGSVTVSGRLSAVLDLGTGFHADLTGEENLRLNASLIGMSRARTAELFDQIVEFSGVGEFIQQPLRTYSAGMIMRLAFSVAVHTDPDILLIDEIIAVGDQDFGLKCLDKIQSFQRQGKTILLASHSLVQLTLLCQRAMWLDHGSVVKIGPVAQVVEAYHGGPVPAGP